MKVLPTSFFVVLTRQIPILLVGLKMTEILVYRFLLGSGPFALKPAANRLRGPVAGAPRPLSGECPLGRRAATKVAKAVVHACIFGQVRSNVCCSR